MMICVTYGQIHADVTSISYNHIRNVIKKSMEVELQAILLDIYLTKNILFVKLIIEIVCQ